MKKITSMLLALALVMSLSVTAFANETGVGTGNYSTEVTGTYVPGTTASDTVFSVDITWEDMSFTYHAAQAPVWDATNHTYTNSVAAYWEGKGTITVANDSNTRIYAVPSYAASTGYEDADMVFSTDMLHVASAEYGNQESGTITVTPSGFLPDNTTSKTIGTITVTIAEDPDVTTNELRLLCSARIALASEIEQSELYASNQELQERTASLSSGTAYALEISIEGNISQASMNTRYSEWREEYYTLRTYFNTLKES